MWFKRHNWWSTRGFSEIKQQQPTANFVSNQLRLYQFGFDVDPDSSRLDVKCDLSFSALENNCTTQTDGNALLTKGMKLFNEVELAGSEISYR